MPTLCFPTSYFHLEERKLIELFNGESAKRGGGKTSELLCIEPPCNVLNGAITQQ